MPNETIKSYSDVRVTKKLTGIIQHVFRGVARNLFWGIQVFVGIKLSNSRSDVIFTP